MFWTISVLLFLLATLFVLVPLWRRRQPRASESGELRQAANIALFHERIDEIEADLAAGNLDQDQYDRLVLELQQNLLADVSAPASEAITGQHQQAATSDGGGTGDNRLSPTFVIPVVLALMVPLVAYTLYAHWGFRDDVQLMGLFERTVNNTDSPEEARDLIYELGEIVQAGNEQPWARYFLAENLANIGLYEQAQRFYQEAAELMEDSPDKAVVLGRVATAMYINGGFELTPEIQQIADRALQLNPNSVAVLQLLAADAEQRQDYDAAIAYWRRLIQINPNSPRADTLRANIAEAQQLPAGDDVAAAAGPVVEVSLSLAEGVELDDRLRVFVAVRNAEREGMPPLAAVDLTVADLPTMVRLDDNAAVGPFNLSSANTVTVSALVSHAGVAAPSSGDYRVESESFSLDEDNTVIELVISDRVP